MRRSIVAPLSIEDGGGGGEEGRFPGNLLSSSSFSREWMAIKSFTSIVNPPVFHFLRRARSSCAYAMTTMSIIFCAQANEAEFKVYCRMVLKKFVSFILEKSCSSARTCTHHAACAYTRNTNRGFFCPFAHRRASWRDADKIEQKQRQLQRE